MINVDLLTPVFDDPEDEFALLCNRCGQRVEFKAVIIGSARKRNAKWDRRRYDLRTNTRHVCPGQNPLNLRMPSPFTAWEGTHR